MVLSLMLTTIYIPHIYIYDTSRSIDVTCTWQFLCFFFFSLYLYLFANTTYGIWCLLVGIQFNCYALLAKMYLELYKCLGQHILLNWTILKHCSKTRITHVFHFPIGKYIYSINRTCPWQTRFLWCNKNYFQLIFRWICGLFWEFRASIEILNGPILTRMIYLWNEIKLLDTCIEFR